MKKNICDFCKNILTNEEYDKIPSIEKMDLPYSFIMKDNTVNQYHLWIECEDCFYSGKYIENIKYCPKCGRKIDE